MSLNAINKPKGFVKLAADLSSGATTLDVRTGDEANLPTNFPFLVTFENDIIQFDSAVGAVTGGYRYNVTRNVETAYGAPAATAHDAQTPGENLMTAGTLADIYATIAGATINSAVNNNLLKNGRFINNSTNGYGGTPDDWTNSNANPVQGGFRTATKQDILDVFGTTTGNLRALYTLNGNFLDTSDSGYDLTANGSAVATSTNGPMAQAGDFELGTSDYATNTGTISNVLIAGSQAWFAIVRPESIPATGMTLIGHSDSTPTVYAQLVVEATTGTVAFEVIGLTTNTIVRSNIKLEAGKLNCILGIYDSANSLLKVWVNGVKTSVTASGSHTITGTQALSVGRLGAYNGNYLDGVVQLAGVLAVAPTDEDAKRFWAWTTYRGLKTRTAGGLSGTMSQTLNQEQVVFLRGKTVTFGGIFNQDTTSVAQFEIDDGSASASTVSTEITANVETSVTKTISSTATTITLRLKHASTTSNVWWDQVRLNLGSSLLPYSHSSDDWSRFPRLLRVNPAAIVSGYQYEEGRVFSWTPVLTGFSVNPTNSSYTFQHQGGQGLLNVEQSTAGTSNATTLTILSPFVASATTGFTNASIPRASDNGSQSAANDYAVLPASSAVISCSHNNSSTGWTAANGKSVSFNISVNLD